jgi:hypothetical protein
MQDTSIENRFEKIEKNQHWAQWNFNLKTMRWPHFLPSRFLSFTHSSCGSSQRRAKKKLIVQLWKEEALIKFIVNQKCNTHTIATTWIIIASTRSAVEWRFSEKNPLSTLSHSSFAIKVIKSPSGINQFSLWHVFFLLRLNLE